MINPRFLFLWKQRWTPATINGINAAEPILVLWPAFIPTIIYVDKVNAIAPKIEISGLTPKQISIK